MSETDRLHQHIRQLELENALLYLIDAVRCLRVNALPDDNGSVLVPSETMTNLIEKADKAEQYL